MKSSRLRSVTAFSTQSCAFSLVAYPNPRLDDLLPWNWLPQNDQKNKAAFTGRLRQGAARTPTERPTILPVIAPFCSGIDRSSPSCPSRFATSARGLIPTPIDEFLARTRTLSSGQKETLARQFFIVKSLTINDDKGHSYFAVPLDGDMDFAVEAEQVAICWQMLPERHLGSGFDPSRVEPGWAIARNDYHGGERNFRLYVVCEKIREHLRLLARNVCG